MKQPIRILLMGCGGSAGINFVRALKLKKKEFSIVGADINRHYLEVSPVDKKYFTPHKKGQEKKYIETLNKIIKKENIDFVHAQPDPEVAILSKYRDEIKAKTFLPSKRAIDIFQDKWKTFDVLQKNDIPLAKSWKINDEESLKKIINKNKGEVLWVRATKGAGGKASLPVTSFKQAKMWIEYWLDKGLNWSDFVASEMLPGREVSWLSVWKDGKLIVSQQKERFEWVQGSISPSGVGGTTAIQKTVSYEEVNDVCTRTVLAVDKNANGIYTVDTKNSKKNVPCVMEINPGRFFTTTLFYPTAGVNAPAIYVYAGMGMSFPKVSQYNALEDDIYWIRIIDGEATLIRGEKWTSETI